MRTLLELYTAIRIAGLPLNFVTYGTLLTICWVYTLSRGGAPERIGATILLIGYGLTAIVISDIAVRFEAIETGVLIIDLLCLAAFGALAVRADRFWPLWLAALQLLTVLAHGVKLIDSDVFRRAYAFLAVVWSYPMIFLLIVGTFRHQGRLRKFGSDKSWS